MLIMFNDEMRHQYLEKNKDLDLNRFVEEAVSGTNLNRKVRTKSISFDCIQDFICDVMLHPMAPEWLSLIHI